MARTTIQQRHEAERARIARFDATLKKPRTVDCIDHAAIVRSVIGGFRGQALRDPDTWLGRLKTKDTGKIALAIAKHVFAAYPVPRHLERVWLCPDGLEPAEIARRKAWYIEVARGGSLYKAFTRDVLTRRETHHFLTPPVDLAFHEALWFAVARGYAEEDLGLALRIARSKLARHAVSPFWRDAARFFCVNPVPLAEVDDFCDFFDARLAENRAYSLKGRTLASLRAQRAAWHRELARVRRLGEISWPGRATPDWSWIVDEREPPHRRTTWTVTQIKTSRDLAEEGNRMHHCVFYYKQRCVTGACSIWSVKVETRRGIERVLTLETDRGGEVVQIRGYANREATAAELRVLRRWAIATGMGGV